MRFDSPAAVMQHALALARRGIGSVEPNPPVGAVLVDDALESLGAGWHQRFGGPHAEIEAIRQAGPATRGATLFVTLEPCCHFGKTPPCSQALIAAGLRRVLVATTDPNPEVSGRGIAELQAAGLAVETGLLQPEAEKLIAPFRKRITTGRPWIIAKWAMTLDGKIATSGGDCRWISNESSRQIVHQLRGRMDAIAIGIGTALTDDPLLTARPPGPRTPVRLVIDSQARLPAASQLVKTAREVPVLVAVTDGALPARLAELQAHGCEVVVLPASDGRVSLPALWDELGRREMTNVLVEGGTRLLGALRDERLIDEIYTFIAPKLVGGETAPTPIAGAGIPLMKTAERLNDPEIHLLDGDVLIHGRLSAGAAQ
jgi:diaminohydroxyphosphoribosylaminopyrimidine deaminase/5-amino-6-(5-phosphoribosylamino)uracil reductase